MVKITEFVEQMQQPVRKRPSSASLGAPHKKPAGAPAKEDKEIETLDDDNDETENENSNRIKSRFVHRNMASFSKMFQDFWEASSQHDRNMILRAAVKKGGRNYILDEEPPKTCHMG